MLVPGGGPGRLGHDTASSGSSGASTCTVVFICTTIHALQKRRMKDFTEVTAGKDVVGRTYRGAAPDSLD